MLQIVILRGISGSGKTTFANKIKQKYGDKVEIVSADHYMLNDDGEYEFNVNLLSFCHNKCFQRYMYLATNMRSDGILVVDNTNCTNCEVTPYTTFAKALGIQFQVLVFSPRINVEEVHKRNVHNVPLYSIIRQEKKLLNSLLGRNHFFKSINVYDDSCETILNNIVRSVP